MEVPVKTLGEFEAYVRYQARAEFESLEPWRRRLLATSIGLWAAVIALMAVVIYWTIAQPGLRQLYHAFIPLIVGTGVFQAKLIRPFASAYKRTVIRHSIHYLEPRLRFEPTLQETFAEILSSGRLFGPDTSYEADAPHAGAFGRLGVRLFHTRVRLKAAAAFVEPLFQGYYVAAEGTIATSGHAWILPDGRKRVFGRRLGGLLQTWAYRQGRLVEVVDAPFEREFVIYHASQPVEPAWLTAEYRRRLVDFKRKARRKIRLASEGSTLHIALPDRGAAFEPSLWIGTMSRRRLQRLYSEVCLIVDLLEDLSACQPAHAIRP